MLKEAKLTGAEARRERGRLEMRAAILEAAGRLIAAEGVEGLTIRAVAQAVGYSAGAIYEYYDSKEAILTSLYFDGSDGLAVHCERAVEALPPSSDAAQALHVLGHAYRTYALSHPELYRLVFGGMKTLPYPTELDCDDERQGGFGTLLRVAIRGIDEGTLIDVPPVVVAFAAWSAVHGFVSLEIAGHITGEGAPGVPVTSETQARTSRDQLFDGVILLALRGMLSEQGREQMDATGHVLASATRP